MKMTVKAGQRNGGGRNRGSGDRDDVYRIGRCADRPGAAGRCRRAVAQDPAPPPAPTANIPTADQLTGILNSLADPNVPFANKSNLVEGGISGTEAHIADHELKKAAKNGDLPLAFNVVNIHPGAASGSATADVGVSGPKIPSPVTQNVTFVNQGSWVLSRASAMELLQAAGH